MMARHRRQLMRAAQVEASLLTSIFGAEPEKLFRVTYDNECSPPTYGDLFQVLMLTRFLALKGMNLEFVLLDDGRRRSDWDALSPAAQEELVAEQIVLAKILLPHRVPVRKINQRRTSIKIAKNDDVHEVLGQAAIAGAPLYTVSPGLLDKCYRNQQLDQSSAFLLENAGHPPQKTLTSENAGPYVAWHIRKGLWSEKRDSTKNSIIQDFHELRDIFPAHSLMIFSSTPGIEFALAVLGEIGALQKMNAEGLYLLGQPSPGFANAIPLILKSDFYFQRLGGGIGMVPIFSRIPYLIFSGDGNYYFSRQGDRLVPWAHADQKFVVDQHRVAELKISSYVQSPVVGRMCSDSKWLNQEN